MKAIVGLVLAVVICLFGFVLLGLAGDLLGGDLTLRDIGPPTLVLVVLAAVGAVSVSYLRRSPRT